MLEATRRTTLSSTNEALFIDISNAPETVDTTCADQTEKSACWEVIEGARLFHLPDQLRLRLETFAQRSTPYYIAEPRDSLGGLSFTTGLSNQFTFIAVSPERGQLLETLVSRQIVVPPVSFNFALLIDANLAGVALRDLELNVSDLSDANLARADLSGSRFQEADLIGAHLYGTNLTGTDLQGSAMSTESFRDTQVSDATFTGVMMRSTFNGTAWAWRDMPPRNLPGGIDLTTCAFDPETHIRAVKPDGC